MNKHDFEWPELKPFILEIKAEPYPINALSKEFRAPIEEVASYVKAPIALIATAALGAIAAALQSLVDVKRDESLIGPCSLFFLSIAPSGERKSTVDKFFNKPLRDYQRDELEKARPLIEQAKAEIDAWEAKRGGVIEAIRAASKSGKPTDQLEEKLRQHEAQKPSMPRIPDLLRGDDTPESLAYDLAHRWPAGAVISSEAGVILGSAAMGKDKAMRNLAFINVLWDGGEHSIRRKTSESFTVQGARLTLSLQVQEETLLEFFKQTGALARGTGFLARFLSTWPDSTQGQRIYTRPPDEWPALNEFNRRLRELLDKPPLLRPDGTLEPTLLPLAPDAKAAWIDYHDTIESDLGPGGKFACISDIASKSADNAARLAALFHVFKHGPNGQIGVDSFTCARQVALWHLNEALRFFGSQSIAPELSTAKSLEDWLVAYCKTNGITKVAKRIIQQYGPYGLRKKDALASSLEILEGHGRARVVQDGRQMYIEMHPQLLIDEISLAG